MRTNSYGVGAQLEYTMACVKNNRWIYVGSFGHHYSSGFLRNLSEISDEFDWFREKKSMEGYYY